MNKKITAAFLALLTLGMVGTAAAQASNLEGTNSLDSGPPADEGASESSNITVSVASKTAIDVKPDSLSFTGVSVGDQVETETTGTNQFGALDIHNIGSEYIDRVWAESTAPNSDPFGTGNVSQYNAGNFVQIRPSNSTSKSSVRGNTSTYHFVNRYEFMAPWSNQSEIPSYIEAAPANVNSGAQNTYVGRMRSGDQWYYFVVGTPSSSDVCSGGNGAVLRVGNTPHSPTSFGTVDFTDSGPQDWTEYTIDSTENGEYGMATGGPGDETGIRLEFTDNSGDDVYREYAGLTVCDETKAGIEESGPHMIRTRYNVQAGDTGDLTATGGTETNSQRANFLLRAASPSNMLFPGEAVTVDTAIEVPQGVAQGSVDQGQVTFYVSSDDSAEL